MVFIYILRLKKGKYYVGKTDNPKFRLEKHFNSEGSEWTKKYKPLEILEIKGNCDKYDEDKITKKFMDTYGIDNVRGGSYTQIELSELQVIALETELKGCNDSCFRCGKKGHFAKECEQYATKYAKHYIDFSESESFSSDDDTQNDNCCFRCGRKGHYVSYCYASKHINGYYLD